MNTLLELQVWLKIVIGLLLLVAVAFAALWIYVLIDFARFVHRITRRHRGVRNPGKKPRKNIPKIIPRITDRSS